MHLSKERYAYLVRKIHHINNCWYLAKQIDSHPLQRFFVEEKNTLQIELIKSFPELVSVELSMLHLDEDVFSLRLLEMVDGFDNACHLPRRVMESLDS